MGMFFAAEILGGAPPLKLPASRGYTVVLSEPPAVARFPGRIERTRAAAEPYRLHLAQTQNALRARLESRNIRVLGAVQRVMNAMFVQATEAQAAQIRAVPGVMAVIPSRRYYLKDQLTLSGVQAAWSASAVGGESKAGEGLKIAIIDTGIDQTHPSFQDSSLAAPAGFPLCDVQANCAFTSNKVIVARSYVSYLTAGSNPNDPAADSRPDDLSARDLLGHGTAVSSVAAGIATEFDGVTVSGVAPKAFLGNYKVFGSPEVNGTASDQGIVAALDDAIGDGMDIANLSLGGPAFYGPLDVGATCGNSPGVACDTVAYAVEQAVQNAQILVVAAAGNEGSNGYRYLNGGSPTFGTIASPADAPSAVAAGGLENDVAFASSVQIAGPAVPSNLISLPGFESADGPEPSAPLTAPLIDAVKAGNNDGLLCSGVGPGAFQGAIALVRRGTCYFSIKVANAQNAGAIGVLVIDNGNGVTGWGGLAATTIPAFMLSVTDGASVKTYLDANSGVKATLNPARTEIPSTDAGFIPKAVAPFASRGPATGSGGLKPDVAAVATNFLLAAEDYDPFGILYSAARYSTADGTSFASPLLAGAAALVKQVNPNLSPLEIKSALVNTATLSGVLDSAGSGAASLDEVGAGLLQAQNAIASSIAIVPSSVSFGALSGALPAAQTLTLTDTGKSAVSMTITAGQPAGLTGTQVQVNNSTTYSLALGAGQSASIEVGLSGSLPPPGRYEGVLTIAGSPVPLQVPYMFVVGDGVPYDIIPIYGQSFDGPIDQQLPAGEGPLIVRVVDRYGAAVLNTPVQWAVTQGGGSVLQDGQSTVNTTIDNGLAFATVTLGAALGNQEFTATVSGLTLPFDGNARNVPAINADGIVDGASFTRGRAVAPGSIVSIFGTALADVQAAAFLLPLPLGLDNTAVSFDVPSAGISVPGRFFYASPTQINVQVPWELAGQSSAIVKVIVNYTYSAEYTLALASYSPGFFAAADNGVAIAAALDANNKAVSTANPVARGQAVQLFLNGLGPVNNRPASGSPAPSGTQAATTLSQPQILIGGAQATVTFSGLAPNFAGLYQVNAIVPDTIPSGLASIACSAGGLSCAAVSLPVK